MLLVLLMIALFQTHSASMPVILDIINPRKEFQPASNASQCHSRRTRFDIIWTCMSTLFVCTWVAIHPNIPPPNEDYLQSLRRRIKLMLYTLVVPELILIWAYKQWKAARVIAGQFKAEKWTPTHGHFVVMGGFVRADNGFVLDVDNGDLDRMRHHDFPTITAEDIQDKSKGDFLSKAIAILQSTWFIVQCIARGTQGLAVTELEVVTLAVASLTGMMYYFWWDKPLGVNKPIKVNMDRVQDSDAPIMQGFLGRMQSSMSQFRASFHPGLHKFIRSLQQIDIRIIFLKWIQAPASLLLSITSTTTVYNSAHVPTFYAPQISDEETLILTVLPIVAVIFGGLHLIAWQFHFPSHVEQTLWRIGSLAITTLPSIPLFVHILHRITSGRLKRIIELLAKLLTGPGLILYVIARIFLLTQAVISLRKQPESAFYTNKWTYYFPHI